MASEVVNFFSEGLNQKGGARGAPNLRLCIRMHKPFDRPISRASDSRQTDAA
ncbi:hypothetical protein [Tsuneonella mangrovi]|uniref:hypothetical protein n=1 Tax=Tsuneonella mangrovi TaxID=1982042 RepID=UPI0014717A94|nr:hypothetical protein [Tsuneonella mangrovi]